MSYNIGDKVCIIPESEVDSDDDWNTDMFKWCGLNFMEVLSL